MHPQLTKAINLRTTGNLKEANDILVKLASEYPDDPHINYQCAWSFDVMGLEKEAVPYYEKAIAIGLPDEDMKEAYLGLGSTYRTIGEYEKSKRLFLEGLERYDSNSLRVFLAMTLFNLGEHEKSMELLLKVIAETSADEDVSGYKKAIEFYSDKLTQLW